MPHKDPKVRKAYKQRYNKTYKKKYYEANKNRLAVYWKQFYEANKDRLRAKQKQQYWERLASYLFYAAKARAKAQGLDFNIEKSDVVIPEVCPIFGTPLILGDRDNTPSLDRINPLKGYVKGNVAVLSFRANRLKNNGTAEEHRIIADWIERMTL